ncbi:hypothetical protein B0H67DRAFT_552025 [Lasiosphaeris hirsuta]|uniref:Uncharacterized protein n=1 Tax=Lasiosphaeris hirsuta TaxID=260670 RepID=A0AA40APS4_9PEZI|nr:hypothetical protein B0H67DRAFT_552025 [Lasiosphaeris hirsuta]
MKTPLLSCLAGLFAFILASPTPDRRVEANNVTTGSSFCLLLAKLPYDLNLGYLVHSGFFAGWLEMSSAVLMGVKASSTALPSYKIIATATIGAAYLRCAGHTVDIYTYGSPRGAEYRVTHSADPIPRLPPIIFNYRHTSPEYWDNAEENATAADVAVCPGYANTGCNAGAKGLDMSLHSLYFCPINGCRPEDGATPWKRDGELTDAEFEEQLGWWMDLGLRRISQTHKSEETGCWLKDSDMIASHDRYMLRKRRISGAVSSII